MQAAVQTEDGLHEAVRIAELAKPSIGPHDVLVQVPGHDGGPDRLCVPGREALLHEVVHRAPPAAGNSPREQVRRCGLRRLNPAPLVIVLTAFQADEQVLSTLRAHRLVAATNRALSDW